MLYNSYSNDLNKNINILNNQNYIINNRIKINLIYNIYFDEKLIGLKYIISMFMYYFINTKSHFFVLLLLHIFIFILFGWVLFVFKVRFELILLYLYEFFILSKSLVNFYFDFKNIKVTILGFRRNLGNSYESKLISFRDYNSNVLNNDLRNLQISVFFTFLINGLIYLIYLYLL
ncbi:MAG: hypothetical protein Q8K30_04100 [Candidatus Gracilibacteria bacterium]|nr:hypothetical protein [Candidatus Gracilibacteria bacterium]